MSTTIDTLPGLEDVRPTLSDLVRVALEDEPEEMTCYRVATILNQVAIQAGWTGGHIREQYVYNYARNGLVVRGRKGTGPVDKVSAYTFIHKFLSKRGLV
jgi:hypothetical protein